MVLLVPLLFGICLPIWILALGVGAPTPIDEAVARIISEGALEPFPTLIARPFDSWYSSDRYVPDENLSMIKPGVDVAPV